MGHPRKKFSIPRATSITGHPVRVRLGDLTDDDCRGHYHTERQEIVLERTNPETQMEETYFHELVEGINAIYDLNIPHNVIQVLGVAFHQAIVSGKGKLR